MRGFKKFLGYVATYIAGVVTLPAIGVAFLMSFSQTDIADSLETDPLCRNFNQVATAQMNGHYHDFTNVVHDTEAASDPLGYINGLDWNSLKSIYADASALQDAGFHYAEGCIAASFWEAVGQFDEMTDEFHRQVEYIVKNAPSDFSAPDDYFHYILRTRPSYDA